MKDLSLQGLLDQVDVLKEGGLPPIIVYAIPVMLFFVGLEAYFSKKKNRDYYDTKDTLAAAAIGIGNLVISALIQTGLFVIVLFVAWFAPWKIPKTWWTFILCIIFLDFCRYWAHRVAHERYLFWTTHVTHHNGRRYNFSVSFRLSWTQHLKLVFFLPVVLVGFDPVVFFIVHQMAVLYQYWIHTEFIRRFPKFIEYIFVTPSHHRVHHGTNPHYIDKNYGSSLIIWDRIFGSFQPEGEQANYGITKELNSNNPVFLVFHEWIDMFKDVRLARSIKDVYNIVWGYPGQWRKEHDIALAAQPIPVKKSA